MSDNSSNIDKHVDETSPKSNGVFKKTTSVESLKTTTIVTPIDLETNDEHGEHMRAELNIIKLENDAANILALDERTVESAGLGSNGAEKRSSKVFMFSSDLADGEKLNLDDRDNIEVVLNDLFDWLLWINHNLETQLVVVGDLDQIEQLIKKYDVIFFGSPGFSCLRLFGLNIDFVKSILGEMNKRQSQLDRLKELAVEGHEDTNGHKDEIIINDRCNLVFFRP